MTTEEVRTTSSTGGQKGVKPERYELIPVGPMKDLARLYGRGAIKYDDRNWEKGYEWSKSYGAIQRHTNAFWGGEDYDNHKPDCPEGCTEHTEAPHLICAVFHCFALVEFMTTHPEFDNRVKPQEMDVIRDILDGRFEFCSSKCPEGEHDESDEMSQCTFAAGLPHKKHVSRDGQCTWG